MGEIGTFNIRSKIRKSSSRGHAQTMWTAIGRGVSKMSTLLIKPI